MDGIGDSDFHELAAGYAANDGREEPNLRDYLHAVREAIDYDLGPPPE